MAVFNIHDCVREKVKANPRLHYLVEHQHSGTNAVHLIADAKDFSKHAPLLTQGMPDDAMGAKRAIDARLKTIEQLLFGDRS